MRCFVVLQVLATFSATAANDATVQMILENLSRWKETASPTNRSLPFVTAAFAQTLDGKMASENKEGDLSSNLAISGTESLILTHALRSMHDGILVGGRTLCIDNPRLTNRLWEDNPTTPRPIVIDTDLKYLPTLGEKCNLTNPIVCCSQAAFKESDGKLSIQCELCPCKISSIGHLDLHNVLCQLYSNFGIRSIMVEGGPTLITSMLKDDLIDAVCVTVAPMFLGNGIGISHALRLPKPKFLPTGSDLTILANLK